MFSFIKSKKSVVDFSFLGTDMHNHLLPGLDDGVKSIDDTIEFIRNLAAMGYRQFYCTPHVMEGMYANKPETIISALESTNASLKANGIDIELKAAAEYMVDHAFEKSIKENKPILTFGENYVLIEMSYVAASNFLESTIFELKLKGLQPVLAHPERYNYLHKDFGIYVNYLDRGCLLQMNLLSVLGYYGPQVKKIAHKLLGEGMINFLGTDLHHQNHLHALQMLGENASLMKMLRQKEFLNQFL